LKPKDRRHSGWISADLTVPPKVAKEESLDLNTTFYDDWQDVRDGMRGNSDRTLLKPEYTWFSHWRDVRRWNEKIKQHIRVRRARNR